MNQQQTKILIIHKRVIKKMRLKNSSMIGSLGEKFAKVKNQKVRIPSLTKTAKYRIPDMLFETELIEVKNVKKQSISNQIKDFLIFCKRTNRKFILIIRNDVILSNELKNLKEQGEIEIRDLGYFSTQDAKKKLIKNIEPTIEKICRKLIEKKNIDL